MEKPNKNSASQSEELAKFKVKKLQPIFVDEVSNISIAPNGACRVYFSTWNTGENNETIRVDAEVIMTIASLKSLANALPNAIEAADKALAKRDAEQKASKTVQ